MYKSILALALFLFAIALFSPSESGVRAAPPDEDAAPERPAVHQSSFYAPKHALPALASADVNRTLLHTKAASFDVSQAPNIEKGDGLANGVLRGLVRTTEQGTHGPTSLSMSGDSVRIEILHGLSSEGIRLAVESVGGEVYGEVPGVLVEALVPVHRLEDLDATSGVDYLRPPLRTNLPIAQPASTSIARPQGGPIVGQQVEKMNADAWHAAGITGQGVKVGIIDAFGDQMWNAAQGVGEVPAPSGTFCRFYGTPCSVWDLDEPHGVAVAEMIHEMAPDAQLYLASAYTSTDLQAVVDYFASQGVDIISRSETAEYDGAGDGTGPTANVVNSAINQGMIWLNSAGNASGGFGEPGQYWRGGWSDTDSDGVMNWGGGPELLPFVCGFVNGVRWSDWASDSPTDYDVIVLDDPILRIEKYSSEDDQASGAPPLETFSDEPGYPSCDGDFDIDYLVLTLFDPGAGTAGDVIEFLPNSSVLEQSSNPFSASGPMSDSSNPGMLSVGAIDPALGSTIANYSSWGPTNDGRTKPDLSAAACVSSYTLFPECFNGTSSATPAVAGAAALVLSAGLANSPQSLATYLKNSTVDRGVGGTDNIFGRGELILGNPPVSSTSSATPTATATRTPTPTGAGVTRLWGDADCDGSISSRDNQAIQRFVLQQNPLGQTEPCPDIGSEVSDQLWADADCDGTITTRDNQSVLRNVLQQNPLGQTEPCPDVGSLVTIGGSSSTPTKTPTATPTQTPTPQSATPTKTPAPTATKSPTPTATATPTQTASATPTKTATPTPSKSPTPSPTKSPSPTPGPTPSNQCADLEVPIFIPDGDSEFGAYLEFSPNLGSVVDLDICVNIDHLWVGDLVLVLEHVDTGTYSILLDLPGTVANGPGSCGGNNLRVLFDDEATSSVVNVCNSSGTAITGRYRPVEPLSVFDGESFTGTWRMHAFDFATPDTGEILGSTIWTLTN